MIFRPDNSLGVSGMQDASLESTQIYTHLSAEASAKEDSQ